MQTVQWEGKNVKGQPTLEELEALEKKAIASPSDENLDKLFQLVKARTTYYGQDYRISFRIRDFLRKHGRSEC
jgi:hypothetical protein